MTLSNRTLLVCCAVTSIATAVGVSALDGIGIINITPTEERFAEASFAMETPVNAPAASDPAERLAYVPSDLASLLAQPPAEQPPPQEEWSEQKELPEIAMVEEPSANEIADDASEADRSESEIVEASPKGEIFEAWATETQPEDVKQPGGPRLAAATPEAPTSEALRPHTSPMSSDLRRRLSEISPGAMRRLSEKFQAADVGWQPAAVGLVAIKDERVLDLYARPENGNWTFIHRYPVLAASGDTGPKLRQGDRQVPEGVYGISFLNPNSRYHVSLRVNYPNDFDRQMAATDGRYNLGGDIMIHGKAVSAGCLAVGDEAAEELFVLAARVGLPNVKLIITPTDFRRGKAPMLEASQPKWVPRLYGEIETAMAEFKAPPRTGLLSFFSN